jgi:TolB-like protein/DNA-binding response OmpR family regulator
MRNRIMVISQDAALRARLAQLAKRGGYRAEVAESLPQARRAGLREIALAIVASDGLDASQSAAVEELRTAVGHVIVVAAGNGPQTGSGVVDVSDEARILGRIAEALASQQEPEAAETILEFAGHRLDLAGRSLLDPAGRDIPLTHGEFGLLRALVERAGRVLSRDQLLQLIAGRDAEAYDRSADMQILRLRRKIEPDPKHPSLIVTVPGSGYKFAARVRQQAPLAQPSLGPEPTPTPPETARRAPKRRHITAPAAERFAPPRLSILVLPFSNIGGDPEQDQFVDGVTESLTTDLSRIRDALVIARNTAFTYKGKPVNVKMIGRELNIRYVLEGSVQRSGNRMRVGPAHRRRNRQSRLGRAVRRAPHRSL